MNETIQFLTQPVVMPAVVAMLLGALAYVLSRWWPTGCKILALVASGWVLALGIAIAAGSPTPASWKWLKLTDAIVLSVELAATPAGNLVVIAAAAFALLITVYSLRGMAGTRWEGKFYAYLIWALGGGVVVALAGNLMVLLVGWEIVTLVLFLMINQGEGEARAGAAKAYGILGFADACLLAAVALLAGTAGGSANWSLTAGPTDLSQAGPVGYIVYVLLLIAALAKAGAVPLHTWIPSAAKDAPAPVMAYLPAALDKLLGIYLLYTVAVRMFSPDATMQSVMMIVGSVTILAAALMALTQRRLTRALAFLMVVQVGYMVLGIGTGTKLGMAGGLFHMLNCALYSAAMFLIAGTVRRTAGTDEIDKLGGLGRALPVTFACAIVSAAAISGVPPLNGFASKWMVYQGTLEVGRTHGALATAAVTIAVFGSALTLAGIIKVIHAAFLSPAPIDSPQALRRPKESLLLAAPMVVLAGACVVLGLAPQLAVEKILAPMVAGVSGAVSVEGTALRTGEMGLWDPSRATVLILIGMVVGLGLTWLARGGKRIRLVRPYLCGEAAGLGDDRFRVPGTHFYETISRLPVIGPLLSHGEAGAFDAYHWAGRHGQTLVNVLRGAHTGLVSLYVAWCLLGVTVTLVYLVLSAGT